MKRAIYLLFFNFGSVLVFAQQDSIFVQAKVHENLREVSVVQEISYENTTGKPLQQLKLLNWISAYKNRKTSLLKRQLEDRKRDLYFAENNDLGNLKSLEIQINQSSFLNLDLNRQNFLIPLSKPLQNGEKIHIKLNYTLQLPQRKFTGYGTDGKEISFKYFFLVPDQSAKMSDGERPFLNIEENQTSNIFWKVLFDLPTNYFSKSNLPETYPNYYEGVLKNDPEFLITQENYPKNQFEINGKNILVDFGYSLNADEQEHLEFYLPLHLQFIAGKTGLIPSKIFITRKFKKEEDFIGNDDLKFWKFRYSLFSTAENVDMDYFGIVAKSVLNQKLVYDKNRDHWLINGLKSYLEYDYLQKFYSDKKLLGNLPEEANIFGMKPLKMFNASKLKLTDRYGLSYQYIASENLDQKITEPFSKLSNFNKTAISHFEMGSLLGVISDKMGTSNFDTFLTEYLLKQNSTKINTQEFLNELSLASNISSNFLYEFISRKHRVNLKLKKFRKEDENYAVTIQKNTPENLPFKIETEELNGDTREYWFDTQNHHNKSEYQIPQSDATKILLNNDYIFPESNYRDNYLYTKGFFANKKRIKLKLFRDIPNPEYNEIYLNPKLTFNAYDNVLLGLNFRNTSLFRRKFAYSFTPYFSTGTGMLTGSGGISYTFMPAESFFRFWQVGVSGSYFHYDYDLSYSKFSAFSTINFTKNPRSDINRSLSFSYNYFEKDLTPKLIAENEYGKYNLWNANYNYHDQRAIHENYVGGGVQWMEDFFKLSAEAYYRWEYAKNKKISFRLFGGYFLNNQTKNSLFNFGISKVSNYAFSYGLIGQSATSGILSQQMILADGGFKSYVGGSANQWIGALNIDSNVWKWFNIYADAGMYKSKLQNAEFIWDSGVKLAVIPDFLEVYFPIQSSLGFEPSFNDYGKRIRFTLVLNFGAITNYFRRGVF